MPSIQFAHLGEEFSRIKLTLDFSFLNKFLDFLALSNDFLIKLRSPLVRPKMIALIGFLPLKGMPDDADSAPTCHLLRLLWADPTVGQELEGPHFRYGKRIEAGMALIARKDRPPTPIALLCG